MEIKLTWRSEGFQDRRFRRWTGGVQYEVGGWWRNCQHNFPTLRTQSSDWLWDDEHPLLAQMSSRLGKATRLKVRREQELGEEEDMFPMEAEAWQVGVYTTGGHYVPHNDDFDKYDRFSVSPQGKVIRH